jgi:hypothetical protein
MDLEEIKEVIRETLAEELQILRKQIIASVEAAAADAFAKLKLRVLYEKDCQDEIAASDVNMNLPVQNTELEPSDVEMRTVSDENSNQKLCPIIAVTIPMPVQNADSNPAVAQDQQENVPKGESVSEVQTNSQQLNPGVPIPTIHIPPIFKPLTMCPLEYLAVLKNFLTKHQIDRECDKLKMAEFGIKKICVTPLTYDSFSTFEAVFLAQDWIKIKETLSKRQIFVEFYKSFNRNETLVEFASRKLKQVENSIPDMPFAQFMGKFMAQVPRHVASAIGQASPETSLQLEQILSKCDALPQKHKTKRRRSKRNFKIWALKNMDNIPPQLIPQRSNQGSCAPELQDPGNFVQTENSNVRAPTEGVVKMVEKITDIPQETGPEVVKTEA